MALLPNPDGYVYDDCKGTGRAVQHNVGTCTLFNKELPFPDLCQGWDGVVSCLAGGECFQDIGLAISVLGPGISRCHA